MLHPAANSHPAPHINGFFWPLLQPTATPRPHINGFLWASKSAVCQPSCSQQAAQGHTSIVSYGRPSLPFASPKILQTLKTLQTLQTLATLQTLTNSNDSPKPDQSLLLGVPGCRLPPFSFTTPSLTENWLPQTVRWSIFPVLTSLATFPLQTGQM